ncbi:MAG TPA: type I phosphomannose isomerase catalytic subunit [Phycisphaerales bacterium]|nr:type I phosphomannose isomerase catalytic subunit [Phycisphaerales bacterium]
MPAAVEPYPLILKPIFFDKVWGGRALERIGKDLPPPPAKVGESWEVADMGATSASGAGGGAARSAIENGPLAGKTLGAAAALWGDRMMGEHRSGGGFPLLVKFLDASENLSVQVHPSPAYAKLNQGASLKTECWYILSAAPGAMIYKGLKPGVTAASFAAHIRDGTVAGDMAAVPAVVGECHNLPSGTVHALGAGVVVAEVQTPSDTTFRVFDWGRTGRELHVEQALACIDFARPAAPAATRLVPGEASARLVTTEFFTLDEHDIKPGDAVPIGDSSGPAVVIVLHGEAAIGDLLASGAATDVRTGQTCVIPAFNAAWDSIIAGPHGARVLVARLIRR